MESHEQDAVLEILQAGNNSEWHVLPEKPAEYPIVIRNGTSESHDIEISVVDPADWATVTPSRLELRPGREATTQLVFAAGVETNAPAGESRLTLELHDFEGTCLGQLVASVYIVAYYRLDMSIRVRGPLLRRSIAEGFVLNCKVVNRGNAECAVQPRSEDDSCIALTSPTVRIPARGEVSFDIEARWRSNPMQAYPSAVKVRARYPHGEVVAEVPWDDVVASLGSMVPPLQEDEGFPKIMRLELVTQRDTTLEPMTAKSDDLERGLAPEAHLDPAPRSASGSQSETSPTPMRVQITPPGGMKYTYGRRVHPWWPPAERFGGRWRVKALPIVALALICGGLFTAAKFESLRALIQTTKAGHTNSFVVHSHRSVRVFASHHVVVPTHEKAVHMQVGKRASVALGRPAFPSPIPIHALSLKKQLRRHASTLPSSAALAAIPKVPAEGEQHQSPCNTGTEQTLANPKSGSVGVSTTRGQITIVASGNHNNLFSAYNQWIVTLNDNTGKVWTGGALKLVSDPSGPHPYPSDFYYSSNIPAVDGGRTYYVELSEPNGTCAPQSLGSFST